MTVEDILISDSEIVGMIREAIKDHMYHLASPKATKQQIESQVTDAMVGITSRIARFAAAIKIMDYPLGKLSIMDALQIAKARVKEAP